MAMPAQAEDVARSLQQAMLVKRLDMFVAEAIDIESAARDKMLQPFDSLGSTDQSAGAAPGDLGFLADGMATADWANLGKNVGRCAMRPVCIDHFNNLRNDIASPLYHHLVADPDILAGDFVFIMQGGACDHDTTDGDRFEIGNRRQDAGTPHLDDDVVERGDGALGGKFVRDGPARCPANEAKAGLPIAAINLVDGPVDIIGKISTIAGKRIIKGHHTIEIFGDFLARIDGKPPSVQLLQESVMAIRLMGPILDFAKSIGEELQRTASGDLGIKLPHTAGGGIAGIGKDGIAGFLAFSIQTGEALARHIDLTADLDQRRVAAAFEALRDAGDMAQIGGDVFADTAIAPGGALHKNTRLIAQIGAQALDLRPGRHPELCRPAHALKGPGPPP